MGKKSSSANWLREHHNDAYVRRAQREGLRSRASYKLLEIQERDRLLRPGMAVIDLGAAPGGWSQVARNLVGRGGRVVACDLLPMDALPGVTFIQGDFADEAVLRQLLDAAGVLPATAGAIDLVMSDMAPNLSGMRAVDQPRAMHLAELALDLARRVLRPGGGLLAKVFQGEGFDELLREARRGFASVQTRKPAASRPRSREVYLLARGFAGDGEGDGQG